MDKSGHRKEIKCGIRGCCGLTKRKGKLRFCAQPYVCTTEDNRAWCYYHNPKNPKKFGEGY